MACRNSQRARALSALRDGRWHSHTWLTRKVGDNWASVSARVRDLRKLAYGSHVIDRRPNPNMPGFFQYRLGDKAC